MIENSSTVRIKRKPSFDKLYALVFLLKNSEELRVCSQGKVYLSAKEQNNAKTPNPQERLKPIEILFLFSLIYLEHFERRSQIIVASGKKRDVKCVLPKATLFMSLVVPFVL